MHPKWYYILDRAKDMKSSIKQVIKNGIFLPFKNNGIYENSNEEYKIPIYQRHYDWDKEQIINLFNDIGEAVDIKKPHYTGSFLLTKEKEFIVIDGQQRIISIFILLKAFQLNCETQEIKNEINKIFFTNPARPYGDYLRLKVSNQDKNLFNCIICSGSFNDIQPNNTKLYSNFALGYAFFKKLKEKYSEQDILKYGFEGLQICELIAEEDVDDEIQKIFRDLNSKGQKLKNSDLIRNYLLMSNPALYDSYWQQIELMFTKSGEFQSDLFEEFIFNYVLLKKADQINENKIFNSYVSYCESKYGEFSDNQGKFDRKKAVTDLFNYSRIFKLFLNINIPDSEKAKYKETINLLAELRNMEQTTSYPFLMRVAMDEFNGLIDVDTLNKVINLVVVYYVRAVVCRIPSGSRRGYLLVMYKNVFGNVPSNKEKDKYYAAVYKYFHEIGSSSKMPTEKDFLNELTTFNLYSNKPVCRQVLKTIVNCRYPSEYREKITVEKPTIEHLLPQTSTEKWRDELGGQKKLDEAMKYVDTLGNLSLAYGGKNSELGNKSRKEKVNILKRYSSSLHELNKDFIELNGKFSIDFIKEREKRLSNIIKSFYELQPVNAKNIYFDNFDVFCGATKPSEVFKMRTPTYIEIDGNSIQINSFYSAEYEMMSYFARNYKNKLEELVEQSPMIFSHPILSKEGGKHKSLIPNTDIYYQDERGGDCFFAACKVASALGIDISKIRLMIRKQSFDAEYLDTSKVEPLQDKSGVDFFEIEIKTSGIKAISYYKNGKMIIVAGSSISKETKPYFNECFIRLREKLIADGMVDKNFTFKVDCEFSSPSAASNVVLGYNSNGRTRWKRISDNKSFCEVFN